MSTGEKIRELRKAKEMTLQELGDKVGVGKSTVRKWETGMIGSMSANNLTALAKALGVSVELLTTTEDSEETEVSAEPNDIGMRIKELRTRAEMSQTELAEKIGESKQTVYKYENGIVKNIPNDTVQKLADVLGCTPAYIMGWAFTETFSEYEKELIRKYRKLDELSKQAIESLMNIELKRTGER